MTLVAALIEAAAAERASDIHIDPSPDGVRVRVRIDGMLSDRHLVPSYLHNELISRIKVLSGLRTDEHQTPQDGRFRHTFADGSYLDIRVAIMPTYHGENAVLRLLIDASVDHTLQSLGFDPDDEAVIQQALGGRGGLVLATGPTGSGKTTTLYALLKRLASPERSLITIEDPVEYALPGVRHIQVNPRTGLTFSAGLRALLRQDPDVIMVGEIRDAETAAVAIHTALTGHLVLSTLHTSDALAVIPRLRDLGVESYLIASTLRLVIAQRLLRRICGECLEPAEAPKGAGRRHTDARWSRGKGCEACAGTGYRGRMLVSEVLAIHGALRSSIAADASSDALADLAAKGGLRPMLDKALDRAARGETTYDEILRAVHAQ